MPDGQPDGLAVDAEGDVWVALGPGGGIARLTPEGELRARYDVPARTSSRASPSTAGDLLVATAGALFRARARGAAGRFVPDCTC